MASPKSLVALAFVTTLLLAGSAPAAARDEAQPQPVRLEQARADYEAGRYRQAFDSFTRLAGQGNAEAARMAVLMSRHGSWLYGEDFALAAEQVWQWTARIENARVAQSRTAD